MEISEKEYFELKEQVRILQEKVLGIDKPQKSLSNLVSELPINFVRNSTNEYPDFIYEKSAQADAWKLLTQIAKLIHSQSWKFYMSTASPLTSIPYIRTLGNRDAPRRIADMTNEQIEISVSMLNEIIPIYNKYFRMLHQEVLYCDNKEGVYRKIAVEKVEEE